MAEAAFQNAYPEWTEYRKKNGLDPLGMQTSCVGLYQTLLPGISNVTLRTRYYGFYVWLCRIYAHRLGDTNPQTWQRIVRRAEALYALIAQHHGSESGVAGIRWAERTLQAANSGMIDFAAAAEPGSKKYYLKQAWGAYGAAYASQLYEIGLFGTVEDHDIPVPGPEIGDPMADAFEAAIGPLADQFFAIVQRGNVTLFELDELLPVTPSKIAADSTERGWYEKILFGFGGLERETDRERRRSLMLILQLAAQLECIPNVSDIRWTLYAGCDPEGKTFALATEELASHRQRWWAYQANDLTHISYEVLLKFNLDLLGSYRDGLRLERLIGEVIGEIKSVADHWPKSWKEFLDQNQTNDPLAEKALCNDAMVAANSRSVCTPQGAWTALKLLAVVQNRVHEWEETIRDELGMLDPTDFRSVLTELEFLNKQTDEDFTTTVTKLIEQRIIRRHLWVALRKLRYQGDYTFLIEADDGRMRLRVKDGPVFTNPRLGPAITFLKDIHLIDKQGLTDHGRKVLDVA